MNWRPVWDLNPVPSQSATHHWSFSGPPARPLAVLWRFAHRHCGGPPVARKCRKWTAAGPKELFFATRGPPLGRKRCFFATGGPPGCRWAKRWRTVRGLPLVVRHRLADWEWNKFRNVLGICFEYPEAWQTSHSTVNKLNFYLLTRSSESKLSHFFLDLHELSVYMHHLIGHISLNLPFGMFTQQSVNDMLSAILTNVDHLGEELEIVLNQAKWYHYPKCSEFTRRLVCLAGNQKLN